jgi:oxygen-independent coproporphyrinogen III oxidase
MIAYDVPAPRYTSYPTVPAWSEGFGASDHLAALSRASEPLSLYLHIPFCQERCLFCGCNVAIAKQRETADPYLDRVEAELAIVASVLGRRTLRSMHWGGGTPTFLDERQLQRVFAAVAKHFDLGTELSIEVDPRVTTVSQMRALRELGFDRLSMGVQDFDAHVQRAIGRTQPKSDTSILLAAARILGFRSVNFDLIYGLPNQTRASWQRTLDEVVDLEPDRIAVFAMAYVPNLKPHQRRLPVLPAGEDKLALFESAIATFTAKGWDFIGMDHFARPEDDLAQASRNGRLRRNFQGYTTDDAQIIGIGASAISDVGGAFAQNEVGLAKYYAAIDAGRLATVRGLARTRDDDLRGALIADLMCNFHCELGPGFEGELDRLRPFVADGAVAIDGNIVRVTDRGRRYVRNVAMVFDAHLDPGATHARAI